MTDHQVWELIDALNRISGTLERIWKSIDPFGSEKYFTDEIQHVGYDEEQCGRTK